MSKPETLESIYKIPGYTFFYWGFDLPKQRYSDLVRYFGLSDEKKTAPVKLDIGGKEYDAKLGLVRITTRNFPNRDVIRLYYKGQQETLKAFR